LLEAPILEFGMSQRGHQQRGGQPPFGMRGAPPSW